MKNSIEDFKSASRDFIKLIEDIDLNKPVYEDGWNAAEIISHVLYYQEYYARVVKALANNQVLPLIDESLAEVNIKSAQEYANCSRDELISKFKKAQRTFQNNIIKLAPNKQIPYKKGGRIYTAEKYTITITWHLIKHTKDLRKK